MKPIMPLTNKVIREMEKQHPFIVALQSNVMQAVSRKDEGTMKRLLFQSLRRFESYMSAEVSKLRNKPKKATKFAIYTRRTISMLKLALDFLPGADQVEAYPTLALTITHYLDIILPSSLRERDSPRVTASNIYSFIKYLFNLDMEYGLDVLICSNVPEDATNVSGSIGFCLLSEVLMDQYLYITEVPTFTKYLTIAAQINEITNGKDTQFKKAIQNLDEKSQKKNSHYPDPTHIQQYLKQKYRIRRLGKNYGFMDLISKLQPLNIVAITRQERLVVVSGTRRRSGSEIENLEKKSVSRLPSPSVEGSNPSPDSLFYFDVKGLYTEPEPDDYEITSTFRSMGIEGSDYDESNETASVASAKCQVKEGQQNDNQSDSELEVIFEEEESPKPKKIVIDQAVNGNDEDDSDLDERDYAEPESGEAVPDYSLADYEHRRSDIDNTEGDDADNCDDMDDDVNENDFDIEGIDDDQTQESYSNEPSYSSVEMEAKGMDEENSEDDDEGSVKTIRTRQRKGTVGKLDMPGIDNQSQGSYSNVPRSSPVDVEAKGMDEENSEDDDEGSVKTIRTRQGKGTAGKVVIEKDNQSPKSYLNHHRYSKRVKMLAEGMDEENSKDIGERSLKTIRTRQRKGTAGKVDIEELDNRSPKSSNVSPSRSSRSNPTKIKIKAKRKAEEYSKNADDNKGSLKTIRLRQKKGTETVGTVGSPGSPYSLRKPQPQPATYSLRSRK